MLRSTQEKEQLVRKFEEIAPFLHSISNFGWVINECDADPHYKILPDYSHNEFEFRPFVMNLATGWHSAYTYRDGTELVHVPEGVVDSAVGDWSVYCYKNCCKQPAHIIPKENT